MTGHTISSTEVWFPIIHLEDVRVWVRIDSLSYIYHKKLPVRFQAEYFNCFSVQLEIRANGADLTL